MTKNDNIYFTNCPLCGNNSYKTLFTSTLRKNDFNPKVIQANLKNTLDNYKKHSRIVRCLTCNLVYTNPMENFTHLLTGYSDVVDEEYLRTEKYRKILLQEHVEHIEKFKKGKRILDVGCFTGYFLELAKEKKWDAYGIEPSVWATKIAKKRNVSIIAKDIQTAKIQPGSFDAITLWDVIEHLPNPKEVLQKCYTSLKKGGIIALGTPNIESIVAKILKNNNPYLVRMHLVFYSPKTLNRLLSQAGFKTVEIYSYGRTFPVSYILDRVKFSNGLYTGVKKTINASKWLANYPLHINIGDSFAIIAKKTE